MIKKIKKKTTITFWYVTSVSIMTVLYCFLSDHLLAYRLFHERVIRLLGDFGRILPLDDSWGLLVIDALIVYWALILIFYKEKR
jgi:hypothetical protein